MASGTTPKDPPPVAPVALTSAASASSSGATPITFLVDALPKGTLKSCFRSFVEEHVCPVTGCDIANCRFKTTNTGFVTVDAKYEQAVLASRLHFAGVTLLFKRADRVENKLFIRGIIGIEESFLEQFFSRYGKIKQVMTRSKNRGSKGFGFVLFHNTTVQALNVAKSNIDIGQNVVWVDVAKTESEMKIQKERVYDQFLVPQRHSSRSRHNSPAPSPRVSPIPEFIPRSPPCTSRSPVTGGQGLHFYQNSGSLDWSQSGPLSLSGTMSPGEDIKPEAYRQAYTDVCDELDRLLLRKQHLEDMINREQAVSHYQPRTLHKEFSKRAASMPNMHGDMSDRYLRKQTKERISSNILLDHDKEPYSPVSVYITPNHGQHYSHHSRPARPGVRRIHSDLGRTRDCYSEDIDRYRYTYDD